MYLQHPGPCLEVTDAQQPKVASYHRNTAVITPPDTGRVQGLLHTNLCLLSPKGSTSESHQRPQTAVRIGGQGLGVTQGLRTHFLDSLMVVNGAVRQRLGKVHIESGIKKEGF